jgi:hypothetical protein
MADLAPAVTVRYPRMRAEAVLALRALADPAYQQTVWVEREYPTDTYHDDLGMTVHVLYDDTRVLAEPLDCVGTVLASPAEAEELAVLAGVLGPILDRRTSARDEEYLADPAWPQVVSAARRAVAMLTGEPL